MPKGFTKELFHDIAQFYDAEVFVEAGRIIRHRAKKLDESWTLLNVQSGLLNYLAVSRT